jgi:hypothetical protein
MEGEAPQVRTRVVAAVPALQRLLVRPPDRQSLTGLVPEKVNMMLG